ncbi:alpha/beta hydrolase [Nonlabens xiamenensis]|uniref:alpha/beta hydrolase n=1 Tax=Nonlabens xiamenensis TaxID=2341043 RepID=UPI000F615E92|nr:alpha/beta fold hydrolase [Nonlabens xiamenensis]
MQTLKKWFVRLLKFIVAAYVVICALLYFFQEKLIFLPQHLDKDYSFEFSGKYEEMIFDTSDGKELHGVLFSVKEPLGLIFILHGNAGSIAGWGKSAEVYTTANYDVFVLDYRGYGKSEGKITGTEQLFNDNQLVYDELKNKYGEEHIIVLGYSLGTGLAAQLASNNDPGLLVLQAPYYNMTAMMKERFPFVPTFLLKYKLATNEYLKECDIPVVIFHGKEDQVIDHSMSQALKNEFKDKVELILLEGQGHNGMTDNFTYLIELGKILQSYR